ncbi:MAG: HAD family hydrolase [Erysipelotrichaceae bacterium]|nr:HAD family hydrolase [Erysipelotrichaceae bacterium]
MVCCIVLFFHRVSVYSEGMIKGILFDVGWTLMKAQTGDWMLTEKFREYCPRSLQDTVDPAQWRKALIKASGPLEELHNAGKLITLEDEEEAFTDFYFTLLEEAGLPADREAANIISRDRTYVYKGKYILADGIHQVLDTLKQQGYRLGILSDTWPSIVPMLEYFDLEPYFDARTYSYVLRTFKPDARMYQDALDQLGLPGEETVFIDDLAKNLDGADVLGIHGILACLRTEKPGDSGYPSITDLRQVPDLVKHM